MQESPVRISPIFKERIWGGSNLTDFNYHLPNNKIGEAWLLCDHEEGKNIPNLSIDFLGKNAVSLKNGRLAFLIKLLDPNEDLSIQVHPSDDYHKLKNTELGKAEVWYVVNASPNASIVYGLVDGTTAKDLIESIKNDKILTKLNKVYIKQGDIIYIPPGTVHALCSGAIILEVQQNSDTTLDYLITIELD